MNTMTCSIASLVAVLQAGTAIAEDHLVALAGNGFSESMITIAPGDTMTFFIHDQYTHNVHSTSEGHAFDLGLQTPGVVMTHKFSTKGKVNVRCKIHPKMKIDVTVQ